MRVSALVRRLQKFALGEKDDQGLVIDMSPAQVAATLGLLKKSLPDLSSVELLGDTRHRDVSDKPLSAEEWETSYGSGVETAGGSTESTH